MKITLFLTALAAMTMTAGQLYADDVTEAYRAAVEAGYPSAAYRAQSYLAPPYCYDLNTWHGVTFTKAVNGRCIEPRFPFTYQDMTDIRVRALYERAGLAAMTASSPTELDLIRRISDWANAQWGHMQPLPYASWDAHEILDRAESGDAFWCTYKAVLFVQACNAAGLTGRILGINRMHSDAHTVTEVYSNEFRKWMLVDPWLNCYYEKDGTPLSARELHGFGEGLAGIDMVFGENGKGTEYWDFVTGKTENIPHARARVPLLEDERKGLSEYYFDIRIVLRNDHTVHPQRTENAYVDGFMVPYNARGGEWWGPQLKWSDDGTPPQITCANTDVVQEFEWPLNEVLVSFEMVSLPQEPVVLRVSFETLTPNFKHFRLEIDGAVRETLESALTWNLHAGTNSLKICTVNDVGRQGFMSEFALEYDPSATAVPPRVKPTVKNTGFEDVRSGANAAALRPDGWQTITSNALGAGEFALDGKEKRLGNYSLKASSAKDKNGGKEYAFIVRSEAFDVNPASDVIFAVWLRAERDATPVDICLLESSSKGSATYVSRVTVGRTWRRYELKCRLHNQLTTAYVGFKVYTGTVWADDVSFAEMGR